MFFFSPALVVLERLSQWVCSHPSMTFQKTARNYLKDLTSAVIEKYVIIGWTSSRLSLSHLRIWRLGFRYCLWKKLKIIIKTVFRGFKYLLDSSNIDASDKEEFKSVDDGRASMIEIMGSLSLLMRMLYSHYGRKVVLLIDEYDVPMAKASEKGYYPQMLDVMKGILSKRTQRQ